MPNISTFKKLGHLPTNFEETKHNLKKISLDVDMLRFKLRSFPQEKSHGVMRMIHSRSYEGVRAAFLLHKMKKLALRKARRHGFSRGSSLIFWVLKKMRGKVSSGDQGNPP